MQYIRHYESPLGGITLAGREDALTGLWFDGQRFFACPDGPVWPEGRDGALDLAVRWLDSYFAGRRPDFTPPLAFDTTPFRQTVYQVLLGIPYGATMTYGEVAAALGPRPGAATASARAVGGAVARNPISLIVPCHRVVGANGALTGYAGGLERKAWLLGFERGSLPCP